MKRKICSVEFRLAVICLAVLINNSHGQTTETQTVNPTDYEEEPPSTHVPNFITPPSTFTAREGETVTMQCQVDDIGTFSTVWQKEPGTVLFANHIKLTNNAHYARLEDRSLQIRKIRAAEGGTYVCVISSNPKAVLIHTLNVLVPPKIHIHPKKDLAIRKDDPLHLNCQASGNPPPTITWKKLDGLLPNGKSVIEGHNVSTSHAQRGHSGSYECMASNGVGDRVSASIRVQVFYKPEIEVDNRVIYSGEGVSSELSCIVHADPVASVIWRKGDGPQLANGENYKMRHSANRHTLQIRKVSREDFGVYACEARNNLGLAKDTMEVSGLSSPAIIKSHPNGEKPDSFLLRWSTNSYSTVIEYLLQLREKKDEENSDDGTEGPWTEVHIPAESQNGLVQTEMHEVTGLKPATMYEAVITVHNKFGWNIPSEPFIFSTEGKEITSARPSEEPLTAEHEGEESTPHLAEVQTDNHTDGSSSLSASKIAIFSLLAIILSVLF